MIPEREEKSFHMSPDEFRRHGHAVVEWIADYYSRIESFPVLSQVKAGEIRESLPANAPAKRESLEAILKDLSGKILPGVTHWQSPNFFAFFPRSEERRVGKECSSRCGAWREK